MTATVDAAAARRASGGPRPETGPATANRRISQIPYLPGLDGLRALAVVAVMVYHANSSWLAGGYLGVEVFFVISGYLITLLLIAEHEREGSISLVGFWMRRARRLLPALFTMMLLLAIWVSLFEQDALGKLRGDVIAGALYGSNWYQVWIGAGYSAGNDFAPLRHLWSLAVEEQFYIVWPLVMLALVRSGTRRIAGTARWLFLGAVAITVIVAVLATSGPQQTPELTPGAYFSIGDRAISTPDFLYLSTITRAGGLLLGSAFAMVWRPTAVMRGPLRRRGFVFDVVAVVALVGLAAMCVKVGFDPSLGVHPLLFRGGLFLTGLATLAVIAAVTHRGALTGRLLSLPVLVWIGTRSYGLYLYHWPIYQIIRDVAANQLRIHEFVLAMIATCIVTELSYRWIETPIREGRIGELLRGRTARRRRPLTHTQRQWAFGGAFAAVALSVFAVGSMATAELKQNEVQRSIAEGEDFVCDTLVDLDCDGVADLDEQGDPLGAADDPADATVSDDGSSDGVAAVEADAPDEASGDPAADAAPDPAPDADGDATSDPAATDAVIVPASTEPPPPEEPAPELLAVGDSVMKGAAANLDELGITVDAVESRSWGDGLDYVRTLAERDRLPRDLVIHLGTNSPISQQQMDAMMEAVADVPQVVILSVVIPTHPGVESANNAMIYSTINKYDNVELLDWAGFAPLCPSAECYASDGIHLRPEGRAYYAEQIRSILDL
ncbi:acyltransferase family protein [Ilumatobacter sp.]|uniref:acyltransferase family protein n=1 Tax=Ilumatobacter sp. TaxID=1967498 RepID=UPI003B51A5B0